MHGSNLFVKNISASADTDSLKELFASFGEVVSVKIVEDRGFAFVQMARQMDAESAMKALNGTDFQGRRLQVTEAQTGKKRRR